MSATVSSLYSLPGLPFTVGLVSLSLYINSSASKITFCATCVVVKMVATHFLKPIVGCASGTRGWRACGDELTSSTCLSVVELSNQNKHVT